MGPDIISDRHAKFQKLGLNQKYWLEATNVVFEGGWRAVLADATLHRVCWVRAITYTAHADPPWTSMGPDVPRFRNLDEITSVILSVGISRYVKNRWHICRYLKKIPTR